MQIAFPTMQDLGLDAPVFNHFGSAAFFVIVNTDDDHINIQSNPDQNHEHGNCQPLAALAGTQVDAVVVGGIGGGALRKLMTHEFGKRVACAIYELALNRIVRSERVGGSERIL